MSLAARYQRFAAFEAAGHSPTYHALALAVSSDERLLERLEELPPQKQQPNLFFAAVRFLEGPVSDYSTFRDWVLGHWTHVASVIAERRTQTNEVGRCATLLPLLSALPQPLALIEVGASAGLCLYPDRYRYRQNNGVILGPVDSPVLLNCTTTGPVELPVALPQVVWRAGIDLNPVDTTIDTELRWLESLVWPEQTERLDRLRSAVTVARTDPPILVSGDLLEILAAVVAQAPSSATIVVFHSAVLSYLPEARRTEFAELVRTLPVRWISNEAAGVFPEIAARLPIPEPSDRAVFTLALDGEPVAFADPHGQSLHWFQPRRNSPDGRKVD